ncbi:helix-turn-helix domain-containing protein [Gordonia sp. DT30]|uniref:helix-turn-helix domain-containing protein n=1 Tax=unclassified Gordonia (in: high G+C Gram-positive bacteria) TaxID=2657482 RepID=UPI003CE77BD0
MMTRSTRQIGRALSRVGRGRQAIIGAADALPFRVSRILPPADLAYWVDYTWIVRWTVTEPHVQQVIPQPVVHMAAEADRMWVHGVGENSFARTLAGDGQVVGVAFRAGGFRGFLDGPVSALTRSVRTVGDALGVDDRPLASRLLDPDRGDDDLAAIVTGWLRDLGPVVDPAIDEVASLVEAAEHDAEITRAEQLAHRGGVSLRTLQRQFGEYVGIGPKWVIQRFRMLDVAAVANAGGDVDWAETAVRLGFTDQSHLTRAFTRVVGTPPAAYVRGGRTTDRRR